MNILLPLYEYPELQESIERLKNDPDLDDEKLHVLDDLRRYAESVLV